MYRAFAPIIASTRVLALVPALVLLLVFPAGCTRNVALVIAATRHCFRASIAATCETDSCALWAAPSSAPPPEAAQFLLSLSTLVYDRL